jgi:hypothetical protein
MLLLLLSLLLLHPRSTLPDLGNANVNDGKYTLLGIWVIGNEAGWFPEIQVCQAASVQVSPVHFFVSCFVSCFSN